MAQTPLTLFERLQHEKEVINKSTVKPRSSLTVKSTIFAATILICTLFFSLHLSRQSGLMDIYNLATGYIWPRPDIKADFTFPIYKDDATYRAEVSDAVDNTVPVYTLNTTAEAYANDQLDTIAKKLVEASGEINDNFRELSREGSFKQFFASKPEIREREIVTIKNVISKFLDLTYLNGFVNRPLGSVNHEVISVRLSNNTEKLYQASSLVDSLTFLRKAKIYFQGKIPDDLSQLAVDIVSRLMRPNLVFSESLTQTAREIAEKSIPKTIGIVRQGEIIISKGERVSETTLQKLKSYERSKFLKNDTKYGFLVILGSLGHATLIYLVLIIYLFIIRKRIFYDNFEVGILSAVVVLVAFSAWLSIEIPSGLPLQFFVIIPALSMLVGIVFDSRTSFYATVTMALMLAGIRGNDYETGAAMLFAGTLAAYSVRDIQSRTQMFKSIFFIFIGFLLPIIAFGLERSIDLDVTVKRIVISVLNSAISPLITFGLLFILERISDVTTDLRLQEYNNLDHPLLLKMNETAPGTYQHTLSMSLLAEKCASAIHANQLLTRVGAYFHDIGKIAKPEYFVENQLDIDNKHDLLSPRKSAETIRNHVLDGVKLAKEYHLPQRIADFIPQHHGTFLIKHFYAKALEESDGAPVHEEDFRYPGPKPQTKEAAIVMICDSAEALSRIANKDREEFEKSIDKTIKDRLLDGQFDECPLTMNDLQVIKETCLRNLLGMAHQRVEYKEIPTKPEPEHIK